jgi:hypothetical protein
LITATNVPSCRDELIPNIRPVSSGLRLALALLYPAILDAAAKSGKLNRREPVRRGRVQPHRPSWCRAELGGVIKIFGRRP